MTNYLDFQYTADLLLRRYTWVLLKKNMPNVWKESNYGGLVPIVPLAQQPEISEYDAPHIVYGYAIDANTGIYQIKRGTLTYVIYDQDFDRLTKTLTLLAAIFERQDQTAVDVNNFTSTIPEFLGLTFGSVDIGYIGGAAPEGEEGGRQSAMINIRYEYHVDYNVITDAR